MSLDAHDLSREHAELWERQALLKRARGGRSGRRRHGSWNGRAREGCTARRASKRPCFPAIRGRSAEIDRALRGRQRRPRRATSRSDPWGGNPRGESLVKALQLSTAARSLAAREQIDEAISPDRARVHRDTISADRLSHALVTCRTVEPRLPILHEFQTTHATRRSERARQSRSRLAIDAPPRVAERVASRLRHRAVTRDLHPRVPGVFARAPEQAPARPLCRGAWRRAATAA